MIEIESRGFLCDFRRKPRGEACAERAPGRRSPLSQLDYLYDEAGNRTATLASVDADGRGAKEETLDTYRYDETYQVTGADYGSAVKGNSAGAPARTEKFTYDAVGNRIEVGRVAPNAPPVVTRYAVNNLNQYTQVGEFAPTHDRNGNLSGMGQWLYRYDAMNRLVFASNGATTARFWYDAKNRCVARSYQSSGSALLAPSSTLTLNTYDTRNLIEERDAGGAQVARYVHGRKIDEIIVMVNRHGTFYPHHDVLGNVTMLTDQHGRLVERYTYSITGQVAISDATGTTLTQSAVGNRWMFTGREWLQEVGLYDYRNRVYSAELGRFLQTDPIRFSAGDVNIYRYCFNMLSTGRDPFGLEWWNPLSWTSDDWKAAGEGLAEAGSAAASSVSSAASSAWGAFSDAMTTNGNLEMQNVQYELQAGGALFDTFMDVGIQYSNNLEQNIQASFTGKELAKLAGGELVNQLVVENAVNGQGLIIAFFIEVGAAEIDALGTALGTVAAEYYYSME